MKTSLIVLSDLHINSTVALCESAFHLDDGGFYMPSKSQNWLRDKWYEFINEVKNLKSDKKVLVLNGDLIDINKHDSSQLISQNKATILKHAQWMLSPLLALVDSVYVTRGTAAHVGTNGEMEETLGELIKAEMINGLFSHYHLNLNINGVRFDISHHGSVGSTPWTRTNSLNRLAAEYIIESAKSGTPYPDVVIRSHVHTHADTGGYLPVRVIQTPAWQLKTEYAHRLGIVPIADIGGLIIDCQDSNYDVKPYIYKPSQPEYVNV